MKYWQICSTKEKTYKQYSREIAKDESENDSRGQEPVDLLRVRLPVQFRTSLNRSSVGKLCGNLPASGMRCNNRIDEPPGSLGASLPLGRKRETKRCILAAV